MLAVGRALLAGPRVLMLDEPSAGLAPRLISDLLSRIRLLVDRGLPVLLVEQNVKAALKVVDHLYLLERGRIVADGPASVMVADKRNCRGLSGNACHGRPCMNIVQQIVNGLVLGSGYACIALGWTILLGVARLVNFAHGQLYMLGAFVTWYAMTKAGLPYPFAIVVAIVTLAALGALMQSAMMGLVMAQNLTSLMIVTLGLGYVLQGGSALIFGGNPQTLPGTLSRAKVDLGSLWFTWQDVLVLAATLVLYGAVWLFTKRTRFGSVIRAVAEDPKPAELFGISAKIRVPACFCLRMLRGRAWGRSGGAALADTDQHGLQ